MDFVWVLLMFDGRCGWSNGFGPLWSLEGIFGRKRLFGLYDPGIGACVEWGILKTITVRVLLVGLTILIFGREKGCG